MAGNPIGKNIAALRRKYRLSQRELAQHLNVTHQAVSKWEKGAAEPGIRAMVEMSRLFGVSLDALLTDMGERDSAPP